jgi:hypothetical protein
MHENKSKLKKTDKLIKLKKQKELNHKKTNKSIKIFLKNSGSIRFYKSEIKKPNRIGLVKK